MGKRAMAIIAAAAVIIIAAALGLYLLGLATEAVVAEMFGCQQDSDCLFSENCYEFAEHPGCVNNEWWEKNYGNTGCPDPSPAQCACTSNRCTVKEMGDVIVYTDRADYKKNDVIMVTIQNNSAITIWFDSEDPSLSEIGDWIPFYESLVLFGQKNGEWSRVPMLPFDWMRATVREEIKAGASKTLAFYPVIFYGEDNMKGFDRFKVGFGYASSQEGPAPVKAYSNEFTIDFTELTECERLENEINDWAELTRFCERDEDCFVDETISTNEVLGCHLVRSHLYDESEELSALNQAIEEYRDLCACGSEEICKAIICAPLPESLECKDFECVEATGNGGNGNGTTTWPPNTDSEEDRLEVESVYKAYIDAGQSCDIELATSIITERTKEIVHYTCSNMYNESKCYVGRDYEIVTKPETAIVYLTPFSYMVENPFFFSKENGIWKLDLYRMAFGMAMGGSTCDSGWGWTNLELRDEFCSYFEGECPG